MSEHMGSALLGKVAASPYILPIVAVIVGVLIVAILVVVAVRLFSKHPVATLIGPLDLWEPTSPVLIGRNQLTPATRGNYTLSFYIHIDSVPDPRTVTPLLTWPGVWSMAYNSALQELLCSVSQTPDQTPDSAGTETVRIPSVPGQRWTQIAMTWEGRTVSIYVNGALTTSWSFRNMPPSAVSSLTIVPGGANGQIGYVQLWDRRLTSGEIGANYVSTCDSRGIPYLKSVIPNPFALIPGIHKACDNCGQVRPSASASQTWEFPYA